MNKEQKIEKIKYLISKGLTMTVIGEQMGLSRQRIHQLYRDYPSVDYYIRLKVLKRDEFNCRACGIKEKLEVHHIDGNRRNNNLDNLITVCKKCHMELEKELRKYLKKRCYQAESQKAQYLNLVCNTCHKEFKRYENRRIGKNVFCSADCVVVNGYSSKKIYKDVRERNRMRARRYWAKYRKKLNEKRREYYQRNIEKLKKYHREYYQKNLY